MTKSTLWTLAVAGLVSATACSGGGAKDASDSGAGTPSPASGGGVALTGAGASFPQPIYSKWFSDYAAKTGVKINYQSIGSGGGIRQLSDGTVDFGASDAPMTDEELSKAKGGAILHIPTVLGAVVLTYNIPELTQPLNLSGDVIADIFLGKITKWNDSRLAALNTGTKLPARDILVVHRSDGSGTTFIFSDYLATVSPAWTAGPGKGKELKWPVGLGARGNEGVSGQVKQTPFTIGYTELAYANQNRLPVAKVRNAAGQFVAPAIASITAAAAGAVEKLPPNTDYRVSIVNAPGADAYPISSFTWLLVYQRQTDAAKGKKLVDFMRWALSEGEASAATLDYAPLPPSVGAALMERLSTIQVGAAS
ncbi:MAG TPA: phosphate ABC transporter substrate-binding protein PstS [Gemmatimonadaceae bacterium]|nr:phosphate ABC transporter substrate-binding protein PstS [Gemmatimonadaceae bacterium]